MRKRRIKRKVLVWLFIIILGLGIFFIISKTTYFKREKEESKKEKIAIVQKDNFSDYTFLELFQDYYFVNKNGLIGAINKQKEVVLDFIYPADTFIINKQDAILLNTNDLSYLFDKSLNLITTTTEQINILTDYATKEVYYYTYDTLYNLNQEVIFSNIDDYIDESGDIKKIGPYLIIDNTIINLENNKTIYIDYSLDTDNYVYAIDDEGNKFYYFDFHNSLKVFQIKEKVLNGLVLESEDNNIYFFTINHGLIKKDSTIKEDDYQFVYSCPYGFQVYYNDTLVNEDCFDDYYFNDGSSLISLIKEDSYYFLNKENILNNDKEAFIVGNYLTYYDYAKDSLVIEDLKGNVITNHNCTANLEYYDANTFICQTFDQAVLVDKDLKPLSSYYDILECLPNTSYCIYKKDNKYGLLENNKVLIEAIYQRMEYDASKNIIIGQSLWGFDTYLLNKTANYLTKEEINVPSPKPYLNLNVDNVITKYDLDALKDLILDNSEFFQKYAYIVENNQGLGNNQDKVMNLFYEVILNKEYMDEDIFLSALKNLKIEKKDVLVDEDADGLYFDDAKRIELLKDSDRVIYHELTHFVDFSINELRKELYYCQGHYISAQAYDSLDANERKSCEFRPFDINFLTEGGAEYYSGYYFNQNVVTVYQLQTTLIGALSYIYGFDTIKDIYFDKSEGYYKLYKLFLEANIPEEDINNFIKYSSRFYSCSDKERLFLSDTIIKLYEANKDMDWTKDKEFTEIITTLLGYTQINKDNPNYEKYLKLDFDFNQKYKNLVPDIFYHINVYPGAYVKTNDASYIILSYYENNEILYTALKYDFLNQKVLDRKTVKFN